MTREQALEHMKKGGKVKHPLINMRPLHLVDGHVREVESGFGFHYTFTMEPKMADGFEPVE